MDVIEGIYIKFGGGVILIYVYYFCYVLEVVVVCNLDLCICDNRWNLFIVFVINYFVGSVCEFYVKCI